MHNRPTLPPLNYRLWLPHCGTYVREADRRGARIIGTINEADALRLPEQQAIRQAWQLIRGSRQPVELRPVEPTAAIDTEAQP